MLIDLYSGLSFAGRVKFLATVVYTTLPMITLVIAIRRKSRIAKWVPILCILPFFAVVYQCIFISLNAMKAKTFLLNCVVSIIIMLTTVAVTVLYFDISRTINLLFHNLPYNKFLNDALHCLLFWSPALPFIYCYIFERNTDSNVVVMRTIVIVFQFLVLFLVLFTFSLVPIYAD